MCLNSWNPIELLQCDQLKSVTFATGIDKAPSNAKHSVAIFPPSEKVVCHHVNNKALQAIHNITRVQPYREIDTVVVIKPKKGSELKDERRK